VKYPRINPKAFHISRSVSRQNCRRHSDSNLVVKQATEFEVSNKGSVPTHHWLTTIEIEVTDMKETVNLPNCRPFLSVTSTVEGLKSSIDQSDITNRAIEDLSCDSRKFTPMGLSLRKVIKQLNEKIIEGASNIVRFIFVA